MAGLKGPECAQLLEEALIKVEGVSDVATDISARILTLTAPENVSVRYSLHHATA